MSESVQPSEWTDGEWLRLMSSFPPGTDAKEAARTVAEWRKSTAQVLDGRCPDCGDELRPLLPEEGRVPADPMRSKPARELAGGYCMRHGRWIFDGEALDNTTRVGLIIEAGGDPCA